MATTSTVCCSILHWEDCLAALFQVLEFLELRLEETVITRCSNKWPPSLKTERFRELAQTPQQRCLLDAQSTPDSYLAQEPQQPLQSELLDLVSRDRQKQTVLAEAGSKDGISEHLTR